VNSGRLGFECVSRLFLQLNSRVNEFVHHLSILNFILGEDIVDCEFEYLFKRFFFLCIQLYLAEMPDQSGCHDIAFGDECATELHFLKLDKFFVIGQQVEPPFLVHPLPHELKWGLGILFLLLGEIDIVNLHNAIFAICRAEGGEIVDLT